MYGHEYNSRGRFTRALLARLIEKPDAHYFLCVPVSFMGDVQADLESQGVPAEQIHTENFGSAM
ncbi:hypothetical protein [Ruegeria arenilitoris]|uniref:hypothetical protein n=1 Tax=Ruegeria arenilitoris TaxID=1173585 RepID=UPI0014816E80|nr:hypothetical protein [Ruegeria arenilitoris]